MPTAATTPEHYIVGKGLGGGSAVNGVIWAYPVPDDIDRWGHGWSYQRMLPHLKRSETDLRFGDRPYHGSDGPIPVWRPDDADLGAVDRALEAYTRDSGVPVHEDLNAPDSTGLSLMSYHARGTGDGPARVTTNDAYLEPARGRDNLTIVGEALVDRLLLDDAGDAVGVSVDIAGKVQEVRADRVVLAAGAIYTPSILMRSGVGPRARLEGLDIPVRHESPGVGANLADHVMISVTFPLKEEARLPEGGLLHGHYYRWSSGLEGAGANDLVIASQNIIGTGDSARDTGGFFASLLDPVSRGSVFITDRSPGADPTINIGALSHPLDVRRMRMGARELFRAVEHPAAREIMSGDASFAPRGGAGRPIGSLGDDDVLDATIRRYAAQFFHPVGTCALGGDDDPMAVVTPELELRGVGRVTVADASVMPAITRANTITGTMMIAEYAAERLGRSA